MRRSPDGSWPSLSCWLWVSEISTTRMLWIKVWDQTFKSKFVLMQPSSTYIQNNSWIKSASSFTLMRRKSIQEFLHNERNHLKQISKSPDMSQWDVVQTGKLLKTEQRCPSHPSLYFSFHFLSNSEATIKDLNSQWSLLRKSTNTSRQRFGVAVTVSCFYKNFHQCRLLSYSCFS